APGAREHHRGAQKKRRKSLRPRRRGRVARYETHDSGLAYQGATPSVNQRASFVHGSLKSGDSRGIGAAITKRLAADGASVAFTYTWPRWWHSSPVRMRPIS